MTSRFKKISQVLFKSTDRRFWYNRWKYTSTSKRVRSWVWPFQYHVCILSVSCEPWRVKQWRGLFIGSREDWWWNQGPKTRGRWWIWLFLIIYIYTQFIATYHLSNRIKEMLSLGCHSQITPCNPLPRTVLCSVLTLPVTIPEFQASRAQWRRCKEWGHPGAHFAPSMYVVRLWKFSLIPG